MLTTHGALDVSGEWRWRVGPMRAGRRRSRRILKARSRPTEGDLADGVSGEAANEPVGQFGALITYAAKTDLAIGSAASTPGRTPQRAGPHPLRERLAPGALGVRSRMHGQVQGVVRTTVKHLHRSPRHAYPDAG